MGRDDRGEGTMGDPAEPRIGDAPAAPGPPGLWDELLALLRRVHLPVEDLNERDLDRFALVKREGKLVGCGALEPHGGVALIRSVAVDPLERGNGLGGLIVQHLERRARSKGITHLYLLTTTAEGFFRRAGYANLSREEAPLAIRTSTQFSMLCPESAAFMGKSLPPVDLP